VLEILQRFALIEVGALVGADLGIVVAAGAPTQVDAPIIVHRQQDESRAAAHSPAGRLPRALYMGRVER